jgi:hypothetical protein
MWHWSGMMGAILLLMPLAATRAIPAPELPRLILLLVAFSYFTVGAYLDRRYRWIGLALAGCYLVTLFGRGFPYLWTLTGILLAASLAVGGLVTLASHRRPPEDPPSP